MIVKPCIISSASVVSNMNAVPVIPCATRVPNVSPPKYCCLSRFTAYHMRKTHTSRYEGKKKQASPSMSSLNAYRTTSQHILLWYYLNHCNSSHESCIDEFGKGTNRSGRNKSFHKSGPIIYGFLLAPMDGTFSLRYRNTTLSKMRITLLQLSKHTSSEKWKYFKAHV